MGQKSKHKPDERLSEGRRSNLSSGHLMVAKHIPQLEGLVTHPKRLPVGQTGARPAPFRLDSGRKAMRSDSETNVVILAVAS